MNRTRGAQDIKLVIADDQALLRDVMSMYAASVGFEVVGCVEDAQSAVNVCARTRPHVLLLDIEMPGRDSLAAITDVHGASPQTKVVVLSGHCRDSLIESAVISGASGYLLKTDSAATIFGTLRTVMRGAPVYSTAVRERLEQSADWMVGGRPFTRWSHLTQRNREVLRYIGLGYNNERMAAAMSLSKRTVERHVALLMDALAIRDRAALQRYAVEQGLVSA